MRRKALIVSNDGYSDGTDTLNQYLTEGWEVKHTTPMPSSCDTGGSRGITKE